MKLLLDENLSERLLPQLQEAFPGSAHIRALSMGGAADDTLWTYAAVYPPSGSRFSLAGPEPFPRQWTHHWEALITP